MRVAIHQPNFLPYLGFFNKVKESDVFVLYDSAQYSIRDYHNRNKIKTTDNSSWISIPVSVKLGQKINEVEIADHNFIQKHLGLLKFYYAKAKYFNEYFPLIEKLYLSTQDKKKLFDINKIFLEFVFDFLEIKTKIVKSSDLGIDFNTKKSTEAIIEICQRLGATEYLSGVGAREYLDEKLFIKAKIKLIWQSFKHPVYVQLWGEFQPNLSILDAIFNIGPETKNMIN